MIARKPARHFLIDLLREKDGDLCGLCKRPLGDDPATIHIDHVLPIVLGGADVLGNLQLAHAGCNLQKGKGGEPRRYRRPRRTGPPKRVWKVINGRRVDMTPPPGEWDMDTNPAFAAWVERMESGMRQF